MARNASLAILEVFAIVNRRIVTFNRKRRRNVIRPMEVDRRFGEASDD